MLTTDLHTIIAADPPRMRVLAAVRSLGLPDCWVATGFVRNCVWDHLHRRPHSPLPDDIDVIWHDPLQATPKRDAALDALLREGDPTLSWSVKNQARMHVRNGDSPYASSHDAMRFWPETATAVGVRLTRDGLIEVTAPFGLDDLFDLVVRPSARFTTDKHALYLERVRTKRWQATWPRVRIHEHPSPA